jgi:hypothetical protein
VRNTLLSLCRTQIHDVRVMFVHGVAANLSRHNTIRRMVGADGI